MPKMRWPWPSGPVRSGSVDPKIEIVGTRTRAARCIVPVSLVSNGSQALNSSINSPSVVLPDPIHALPSQFLAISSRLAPSPAVPNRIHRMRKSRRNFLRHFRETWPSFRRAILRAGTKREFEVIATTLIGLAAGNCGFTLPPPWSPTLNTCRSDERCHGRRSSAVLDSAASGASAPG